MPSRAPLAEPSSSRDVQILCDRGEDLPLDERPAIHDLRVVETQDRVPREAKAPVMRNVRATLCRLVIGESVQLDDESSPDEHFHVVAEQRNLLPCRDPHSSEPMNDQ